MMGASALTIAIRSSRGNRVAAERGDLREVRALRAARRLRSCWWFLAARRTARHSQLDRWGIDLVIDTVDLGCVMVQVKSTEAFAEKFRAHGRELALRYRIHTIVVDDSLTDAEVYGRILGTCIVAREEAEARGLTCDDALLCDREAA